MRTLTRSLAALTAAGLLFTGGGLAYADQLVTDGDTLTSGRDVALNTAADCAAGKTFIGSSTLNYSSNVHYNEGSTVTASSQVTPADASGITVGVSSTSATGASSTTQFTVSSWDTTADSRTFKNYVTVPANAADGTYTVRVSTTGVGTNFSGRTSTSVNPMIVADIFTVTVACDQFDVVVPPPAPPNTAPTVTVTGLNSTEYVIGAEPTAGCSVTDAEQTGATATPVVDRSRLVNGLGTVTVTCSFTDGGGLIGTDSKSYTVVAPPNTAPTVTVTGIEGTEYVIGSEPLAGCSVQDTEQPTAATTPDIDRDRLVNGLGTVTVTCSFTDAGGLTDTDTASYTVVPPPNTAPQVAVTGVTNGATYEAGAVPTADCMVTDEDPAVSTAPQVDSIGLNGEGVGRETVTCSYSDSGNLTGSASVTYSIEDTTAPALTGVPADITKEATSAAGAPASWTPATALGRASETRSASCSPASGATFAIGTTTVTCTAVDGTGNESDAQTFTVTVQDTTAPTLSNVPTNLTVEATGPSGAPVSYTPTATDAVDSTATVTCSPAAGATFPIGTTTVTCTAVDATGNESDAQTFTVTVQDTTAPTLSNVPTNLTVEATGPSGAPVSYTPTATDAVDSTATVTCSPAAGATFPIGTTTVTCTAVDATGNESDAQTFTVTVQDTTAPTLSNVPTNQRLTATSKNGAIATWTAPTAIDPVDPNANTSCTSASRLTSGATFALGTTTVTCTATDARGNTSAPQTFTVNVTYSATGALQPINGDGSSIFKLGSTVPVKFQLTGASAGITDAVASIKTAKIANGVAGAETEGVTSTAASAGSAFRYDATSGQYIYNWGTKGLSDGTYQIRIDLGDGNGVRTVNVSLRK